MLYCTMCNALFLRTIIYQCFCGVHCSDTSPIRKHYVSPPASLTTAGPGIWRQYKGRAGGTPGSPGAAPLGAGAPQHWTDALFYWIYNSIHLHTFWIFVFIDLTTISSSIGRRYYYGLLLYQSCSGFIILYHYYDVIFTLSFYCVYI